MSLEGVNCSLVCCNYQKEQTKCSKNFRITTVVLGILLTGAGVGIAIGVGSFGWALVSAGIVSFMIGTCCFYPKKEQSYRQSRPVQHIERPRNAALSRAQGILEQYENTTQAILQATERTNKDVEALLQARNNYVGSRISELKTKDEEQEVSIIVDELDELSSKIREYKKTNLTNKNLQQAQLQLENYSKQFEIIKANPLINHSYVKYSLEDVTYELGAFTKIIEQFKQSAEKTLEETTKSSTTIVSAQLSSKISSDPAKAHEALMTTIIDSEDPAKAYNDNLQKMQDLKRQEWNNQADVLKQIQKWEGKIKDLKQRVSNLSEKITLENLEDCKKQRANLQAEFKKLENEPEIATLKSIYNSAHKSRLEGMFMMVSNLFRILDVKIELEEDPKEVENQNKSEVTNEEAVKKWEEKLNPVCWQIFKFRPLEDRNAKANLKEYETKIAEFEQSLNQLKKEIEDIPNKQRADELMIKAEGILKNKKRDVENLKTSKSHVENPVQPTTPPLLQQGNASQNLLSQSRQQIMNPQGRDPVEKSEYQKNVFENFLKAQKSLMEEQKSEWEAKKEQEQQAQSIKIELRNLHSEIFAYYKSVDIANEGLQQVESKLEEYKSKFGVIKAKPFNDYDLVKTYSNEVTFVLERLAEKIQTFKQSA